MLFNGTIYDNIKFGNENADGNNLSGGQKKRIAIARALVKNADILLLDEITSALDCDTEEQILRTIKEISRQKTVLLVTHNNNIVKYANRIVNI